MDLIVLRSSSTVPLNHRFSQRLKARPSHSSTVSSSPSLRQGNVKRRVKKRRSVWSRLLFPWTPRYSSSGFWSFRNKYRWRFRNRAAYRRRRWQQARLQRGVAYHNKGWSQPRDPTPTRKQLDRELDDYMSLSKRRLDRELDNYMSMSRSRLDAQLDEYMAEAGGASPQWD